MPQNMKISLPAVCRQVANSWY